MVDGISNRVAPWPATRSQAPVQQARVNGMAAGDDSARKALAALFGRTNRTPVVRPLTENQTADEFAPHLGRHLDVIA